MWMSPSLLSVLIFAANSSVPRLTAPEAVARAEDAIPSEGGLDQQRCVPGWRYGPDPQVISTSAAGLRRARHLQQTQDLLAGSKKAPARFFLDLFCSDAAFKPVLELGALPTRFEQATAVLGGWSQDLCGPMQVVVVARAQEHFVGASFDLKHVFSTRYACDDRPLGSEQECAARDECLKQLFSDPARQETLKQDLRKALDALVFTP